MYKELNRKYSKGEKQTMRKHFDICSVSVVIRNIKTNGRFHLITVRNVVIRNTDKKCWEGCG